MRRIAFILTALLLPAFSTVALADDTTRITVKVVNVDGTPVDRANVRVAFKEGRHKIKLTKIQHSWEMKTSQEGVAKIPAIEKGDILVQVTAEWHQSFGQTFEILEDERTIEVVLKEPQDQYSAHEPLKPAEPPKPDGAPTSVPTPVKTGK